MKIMQGKEKNFLDVSEDIGAFQAKIKLWIHQMESGKLAAFPILNFNIALNKVSLKEVQKI